MTDAATPPPCAHNLPAELSAFVGRTEEIGTVARLVASNRLVTLTGSGGAGKTRLAQRVAASVADEFADGVWWIELASTVAAEQIATTILGALGEPIGNSDPLRLLVLRLATSHTLLVVDNCEHLVEDVAEVLHAVLSTCPSVSVLATSRTALNLPGEVSWRVPPLASFRRRAL
ncbi:MAG TPA: NACHT domain-containing protein, partial [Ilumatobacteraceae bacterium]|nr:NACHT domain-containing protein [Ilumatobacteraceae bacterium]